MPEILSYGEPRAADRVRRWRTYTGQTGANLLVVGAGEIGTRVLAFAAIVLLARHLEPAGFGVYSTLLAYFALAASLGNLGLDRLTVRELAAPDAEPSVFASLLRLRLASAAAAAFMLLGAGVLLKPDAAAAVALLAAAMLPLAAASTYSAAFQARQEFATVVASALLATGAVLAMVVAGLLLRAPLTFFIAVVLGSELVRCGILARAARHAGWARLRVYDSQIARRTLRSAAPFAALALLGTIYFRIDIIMLDMLVGGDQVGFYAGAFRVMEAAMVVPALIGTVLFPRFARLHRTASDAAAPLYLLSTRLLLAAGVIVAAAGVIGSSTIVSILFTSEYAAASVPMIWLMIALALLYWHSANATVLFASARLGSVVRWSVVTVLFSIGANLVLIPRYGAAGAAAATVSAEFLSLLIFTPLACRQLGIGGVAYVRGLGSLRMRRSDLDLLLDRSGESQ